MAGSLGGRGYHVLQSNLQRSKLATAELILEAGNRRAAFALVQEPYIGAVGEMRTYPGVRVVQCCNRAADRVIKAAILVFDEQIDVIQCPTLTTENIAVAKLRTSAWEVVVMSIYLEGDKAIEPYGLHIAKVVEEIGRGNVVLGGDVNAWNTWWGSRDIDERGEEMAALLEELDLQILNQGTEPTFDTYRGGVRYTSNVDITACSSNILGCVSGWRVAADVTCSDHAAVLFELKIEKAKGIDIKSATRKFNTKKANWSQFHAKLAQNWEVNNINKEVVEKLDNTEDLEKIVGEITQSITQVCTEMMPLVKKNRQTKLPWWSEQLATLKKEVLRKKRRISSAGPSRRKWVVDQYLKAKEEYLVEAQMAQTASWKEFCSKQDRETMWDGIYRVIGRTATRHEDVPLVVNGKQLDGEESARLLAETFYPEDRLEGDNPDHQQTRAVAESVNVAEHDESWDPPFTSEELRWSAASFSPKKAPGLDGFTADICSAAICRDPDLFLAIFNKCLSLSCFPTMWKEAVVVVLRKSGKADYTHPKSYRPIGLLPVLGKILEKMMMRRIRWQILPGMSEKQYGFTPQRSTEDSLYVMMQYIKQKLKEKKLIVIVSLDIEGAFDSAWWPAVRCRLAETGCSPNLRRLVDSYLKQRKIRIRYAGTECERNTTKGCVQGSIGGPTFWNLLLDPLLKDIEGMGEHVQAFADDIVLIVSGNTGSEVQGRANAVLSHVWGWGVKNKLKFAPQKTQAMVVTNKLRFDTPALVMGGECVGLSHEIKILGLTVDNRLTFNAHVSNVCRKALNLYKQLARAAKIHWGLGPEIVRTIYLAVVEPVILYAASAWAPAAHKICVQKQLNAVQRGFVQKIVKAYRTVSLNSALILAGLLPLDLRIQEAASLFEIKRGHSQRVLGDREVEKRVAYKDTPHPAQHARLTFENMVDVAEGTQLESGTIRIYTDGSKIQGKVGAALSVWEGNVEVKSQKLKLESFCSVYQAELLALEKATKLAVESRTEKCNIYSDSRSALETIVDNVSLHPLAERTRTNLQTAQIHGKIVNLFWVKAHVGVEGNERADALAKGAALGLKKRPDYDLCPVSFVKRQIRLDTLDEWNRRYKEGTTASGTKIFFPDAVEAYRITRKIKVDHVLAQVITGHGGFSEYLYRFKCKENSSCICDPKKEESIVHAIVECPVFGSQRQDLEIEIGMEIKKESIYEIISGTENKRSKFLEYCRKIAMKIIKRNKTK